MGIRKDANPRVVEHSRHRGWTPNEEASDGYFVMPAFCPRAYGGGRVKRLFDLDDEDVPFIRRWNALTAVLLVEPSVKLVARLAMDFADFDDGASCFPSVEMMTRESGLSDRTVRNGWAVMRGLSLAARVSRGGSYRGHADEYQLQIPDGWRGLPLLGPHRRKFTCPGCGNLFNPDPHSLLTDRDKSKTKPDGRPRAKAGDAVGWIVGRLTFCSWPSETGKKGSRACTDAWDARSRAAGEPTWAGIDGPAKWKVFEEARNDPW